MNLNLKINKPACNDLRAPPAGEHARTVTGADSAWHSPRRPRGGRGHPERGPRRRPEAMRGRWALGAGLVPPGGCFSSPRHTWHWEAHLSATGELRARPAPRSWLLAVTHPQGVRGRRPRVPGRSSRWPLCGEPSAHLSASALIPLALTEGAASAPCARPACPSRPCAFPLGRRRRVEPGR